VGEGAGAIVNDPIDDAKGEVREALKARRAEPAKGAAEAAQQVTEARAALTRDLDVLRSRLPEPSEVSGQARTAGGALGVVAAVVAVAALLLRRRSKRRDAERHVREQAVALARELARLDLDPEEVVAPDRRGAVVWIGVIAAALAGLAGAVVAVRRRLEGDDEAWEA
jgi:hypothetical protein